MRVHLTCPPGERFVAGFTRIRQEFQIPTGFAADVVAAAHVAAIRDATTDHTDRRDVDLVTIDPAGSRDLDQAFGAARCGDGYRVRYAIADVGHFVVAGSPIDGAARRRGVTFYSPDGKASLHPDVLNQGAASLLPDKDTPALLWTIDLDATGTVTDARVSRSLVRSRAALTYEEVQAALDAGEAAEELALLGEIGRLRQQREVARGGVSLNLPGQEVVEVDGHFELQYRKTLAVEDWNAHISLMTGMAAARIMLEAGAGLLRVLPEPEVDTLRWLQRSSRALDVPYPQTMSYGDWVRSLDSSQPVHAALLTQAARGFRGAGYVGFEGSPPDVHEHAAIASPYAHVTAPLRRLIDRFANEIVLAHCADRRPPGWALAALADIPEVMTETSSHSKRFEKALIDFVEAMVLLNRVGEHFEAVVTSNQNGRLTLQVRDPAVITRIRSEAANLGDVVEVRLEAVDPETRALDFAIV